MSKNICFFCNDSSKDTQCVVLNAGELWLDFCEDCGNSETLENDSGEKMLVQDIAVAVTNHTKRKESCCVREPDPEPAPEWGSDLEYDADTLAGAGYGTDEDYGGYEDTIY